ncbi:EDD domain protein, DegV family [Natronincola peptidivorans]|uniref:EDD domain protein, DegV family n=1 Tax=Natronincola peptidivorans TaxID=426128 RepID=A0A1I0FBM3_9FIRM|nr:DegV family protein [Natronincola peptidivorans]SET54582.1 EDD domain protein, DegV family [Natronincola peptidivorans]
MSKIKVITDSTAYIDRDFAKKNNIEIVPLSVNFGGTIEEEGFPGEFEEFFHRLATSKDFPTTSQPSAGAFSAVYNKALEEGCEIIVLTISSKLSGTYSSATTAATLVDATKVSVIDSESSAANLRALVEITLELINQGLTRQEIVDRVEAQKKRMGIYLTVGTLDYLKKGGRLTGAAAFFGSLLNIRPIIALKDGKLEGIAKVRGKKKALEKMIEAIPKEATLISICHIFAIEEALEVKTILQQTFPSARITIEELGPVIGAHLGPKALGICFKY